MLRHRAHPWQEPFHAPTVAAFEALQGLLPDPLPALVIDAGCGTGESTRVLAERHPDAWVIGVDRSLARLSRGVGPSLPVREGRCAWVRAELATFWRLAARAGWQPRHHWLLYPNPWPKPGQLQRRWHGHPVFPVLMEWGGAMTLRCNWAVYASEFEQAVRLSGRQATTRELTTDDGLLSPFERKYRASGHRLFEVRVASA